MSFSYTGHYKYLELGGALEDSISGTLNYNMMEMHARSQEALDALMQQQQQQQHQQLPEEKLPPPKPAKVRNEQHASYKRAQTNAQRAHNDRIRKKNEDRIRSEMQKQNNTPKKVTMKAPPPTPGIPSGQLQKWAK